MWTLLLLLGRVCIKVVGGWEVLERIFRQSEGKLSAASCYFFSVPFDQQESFDVAKPRKEMAVR